MEQSKPIIFFEETTVSQVARDLCLEFRRASTDDMDTFEKLRLMQYAAGQGREEFTDIIIALLPPELRLPAAILYDQISLVG